MRRLLISALLIAGCSSPPTKEERTQTQAMAASSSSASAAVDYLDLEQFSGQVVTLSGTFDHQHAIHGIVVLRSGLRVTIPHFDLFARGDDWLKYVGNPCWATGKLHTWTRNIPGYHGPTLEITDFSGQTSE